ncbi:MAG: hypothetical protein ACKO3W_02120, partial [bacterium]
MQPETARSSATLHTDQFRACNLCGCVVGERAIGCDLTTIPVGEPEMDTALDRQILINSPWSSTVLQIAKLRSLHRKPRASITSGSSTALRTPSRAARMFDRAVHFSFHVRGGIAGTGTT